jgi:L-rhamnose isomerase
VPGSSTPTFRRSPRLPDATGGRCKVMSAHALFDPKSAWQATARKRQGMRYLIARAVRDKPTCLVAERHWDQVGWAISENAWRFTAVSDEVL